MSEVFGESNATFVSSLREEAAQEDGAVRLQRCSRPTPAH